MINKRLETAKKAVLEAGHFAVTHQKAKDFSVTEKHKNDFVTEIDLEAEELIKKILIRDFPEDGFFGEETGVSTSENNNGRWVIDPIDGTTNFARGMPLFSISVAWETEERKPLIGVVYLPVSDELYWAEKGGGSWCNGERIHCSSITDPSKAICACVPPHREKDVSSLFWPRFKKIFNACSETRSLGTAAAEMCYIASGRIEVYFEYILHYYDMAAGKIIVEEAGGRVEPCPGTELKDQNCNIICSNGNEIYNWLKKVTN